MPFIINKPTNQFSTEPHPEGITQAVCVDVHDLGMQKTKYGEKHKCNIRFETPARDSKGAPIWPRTWPYSVSLSEKSNLRKDLEKWRGRAFSPQELASFDLESLIGAPAMLNIVHNTADDGTVYSNINGIFKDTSAMKYQPSGLYVRKASGPAVDYPLHSTPRPEASDYDDEVGF